ncbi:hypothetical protein GCM10010460_00170 [Microbacterium terrae]|nr:hypothetical protein GCM10017594_27840 [Microbacterium terrae]
MGVVGARALSEGLSGRFDTALADLDDGGRVVVRVPVDASAATEIAAEVRALRALTPGVRGLLPFRAPEVLGEASVGAAPAVVVDFLPGYRVDAQHLPAGRGAATSLGAALAALHSLPVSIVRGEGLPVRTPEQVRSDAARVIDRAGATHRLPVALAARWQQAVDDDALWRFESAVVLGGVGAASFLFEDADGVPGVTGLLEWHGLSVGDPAVDLQWLASAPEAADDVYAAYVAHSDRAPDAYARDRARLYAELEFAKWLLHGHESGRDDIVGDAVELLESLAHGVSDAAIASAAPLGVDDALALLDRTPGPTATAADTSMHTDAYDPDELSLWVDDEGDARAAATASDAAGAVDFADPNATAPLDLDRPAAPIDLADARRAGRDPQTAVHGDDLSGDDDPERASEAALRRWLAEG